MIQKYVIGVFTFALFNLIIIKFKKYYEVQNISNKYYYKYYIRKYAEVYFLTEQ
jgi:hypothetical protein